MKGIKYAENSVGDWVQELPITVLQDVLEAGPLSTENFKFRPTLDCESCQCQLILHFEGFS